MSPAPPRQRQVRLTQAQQAQLIQLYLSGAKLKELAEQFGIARGTVSEIVKRGGAERPHGLASELVDLAAEQYVAGDSLATIGFRFGVSADTVRARLLERGVTIRPAGRHKAGL